MTDLVKRTTLIVRDAEAAVVWYEQVFGMTWVMDTPLTLSGTPLAAGARAIGRGSSSSNASTTRSA